MPDDTRNLAAAMQHRGAVAVTIRAPVGEDGRMARSAAYRIPLDSPDASRLDQLYAGGHLDARLYANACAVWRLYDAAGLGRSKGVAEHLKATMGHANGEDYGPEDEMRHLIAHGGVGMQAVLMLIRGDVVMPYMWARAVRHLDTLDHIAARWDGECWRSE